MLISQCITELQKIMDRYGNIRCLSLDEMYDYEATSAPVVFKVFKGSNETIPAETLKQIDYELACHI